MKANALSRILGLKKQFNYERKLYITDHTEIDQHDIIVENKLITRQGHLD